MWYDEDDMINDWINERGNENDPDIWELSKARFDEQPVLNNVKLNQPINLENSDNTTFTIRSGYYTKSFYTKAVGVTYGNRQQNISTLKVEDKLKLVHEPNNKFDSNALLITTESGLEIGYISKCYNQNLLAKMQDGELKSVTVANITGDGYANKGVNLKIDVLEKNTNTPSVTTSPTNFDSYSNSTEKTSNTTNPYHDEGLPLGCWGVIVPIIIILIMGLFEGGIT